VRHPLWGVLVGLLAAVAALALAVVALGAIVWIRTEPVPAPTGPDVTVTATVTVVDGRANAILSLAGSQESATVGGGVDKDWEETVHFGETIRVDVLLTDQGENEETFQPGTATCRLTAGTDHKVLRSATVSVVGGTATCSWTNTGKA
jgi:hypothetical protein